MQIEFGDAWVDGLGARLRRGIAAADRSVRADYRSFQDELDLLRARLVGELGALAPDAEVSSRTKRIETVIAKLLRRPDLSLSQITDLAGARIVVADRAEQRAVVARLQQIYAVQDTDDKSESPKSGYRAVHLDIRYQGRLLEIQVQTRNQRRWQQVSEVAAGYDVAIKYGGGNPDVAQALLELSELALQCDRDGVALPDDAVARAMSVIRLAHSGPPRRNATGEGK